MSTADTKQTQPISPKEAVDAAAQYFTQVVGPINAQTAVAVEELEMSNDKKRWLVTLSHKDPLVSSVYTLYPGSDSKLYKVFDVDALTGKVNSMKSKKI